MTIDLDEILFGTSEGKRGKRGISIVGLKQANGRFVAILSNGMKFDAGPIPKDGKDGTSIKGPKGDKGAAGQSTNGIDGKDGRDGLNAVGSDGKDGRDGQDGRDGVDGIGTDGTDGVDGVSVVRLRVTKEGEIFSIFSDGTEESAGKLPKSKRTIIKGKETFYDILPWGQNKGDITVYTGNQWVVLDVGTDGQSLVADSTTATGVAWSTVGVVTDKLLLENGDALLLENGDNLLLE